MLNISFALSFHSIGRSTFPVHTYILTPVIFSESSELVDKLNLNTVFICDALGIGTDLFRKGL